MELKDLADTNGEWNQPVHTNIASTGAENATNTDTNCTDAESVKQQQ